MNITVIFLCVFLAGGLVSAFFYYRSAKRQKEENERVEQAMYLSYPRNNNKFGKVEFGASPGKTQSRKKRNDNDTGASKMEMGSIYEKKSEESENFVATRVESERNMRNKLPPPPSAEDDYSQRSNSPPPSPKSSSAYALLPSDRQKSHRGGSRSPSPTRPASYRGSPQRSPSTRSRFANKSPKRNTRKIQE